MSRCFLLVLLLFGLALTPVKAVPASGSGPKRAAATEIEQTLENARLRSRPAVLYFQMQGCSWCRRVEAEVLAKETVKQKLSGFEVIKVDIFKEKLLAQRHGIRGAPSFVFLDASGQPVARWAGFLDTDKMLKLLDAAAVPTKFSDPSAIETGAGGGEGNLTPPVILKLRRGTFAQLSEDELAQFVLLGAGQKTKSLSEEILEKQEFPARLLLPLLGHKLLAVRLGALQLLEDRAGGTFGFNAWAENSSANREALQKWTAWADGAQDSQPPSLDPDVLNGYIHELLSDDDVRSQRGFRALLRAGESGIETVSGFERLNSGLNAEQKGRLQELRAAVVLGSLEVADAESLAHRLIFGNLDGRIQAMAAISALGPGTLPILDEFLASKEPLEREAAVECVLRAGHESGLPRIGALLQTESDANVIHVALSKLGEMKDVPTAAMIRPFVKSDNEDLAIAALESLARLEDAGSAPHVLAALKDERWRVRVAALKATAKLSLTEAEPSIKHLLQDPDEFVRISAVQAVSTLKLTDLQSVLEPLFVEQDALKPAIAQSFARGSGRFNVAILASLAQSPPDVVLAVMGSIPDADANTFPLIEWAASHHDDDIACAALRLVASKGMEQPEALALVTSALTSGNPRKVQAVLSSIVIDRNAVAERLPAAGVVTFDSDTDDNPSAIEPAAGVATAFGSLVASLREAKLIDDADRLDALILLAQLGEKSAASKVGESLSSLSTTQRARFAEGLSVQRTAKTRSLFAQLLDDPESKVRNDAVSALFEDGADVSCAKLLLEVLLKPGSQLRASEANHHSLTSRYSLKEAEIPEYRALFLETLQSATDPAIQVLSLNLLGGVWGAGCVEAVKPFLTSENPLLRRAAAFAIGRNDPRELQKYRDQIRTDTSPYVRATYPASFIRDSFGWKTYFSESEFDVNFEVGSSRSPALLDPEDIAFVTELTNDPDSNVQMMAGLCLFSNVLPFDTGRFFALVKRSNEEAFLGYTIHNVFQRQLDRMPDEYALLVPLMTSHPNDNLKAKIERRFPTEKPVAREVQPSSDLAVKSIVAIPPISPPPSEAGVEPVKLVYFSKPGCSHCSRVKAMLARVAESFPELEVAEFNINKNQSMELNESLSRRFGVPENLRLVAPAVFTAAGFLVNDDIVEERVGDLILRAAEPGNAPLEIEAPVGTPAAAQAIAERYERINPAIILSAGVLDGLNPCAFATIIFLLSYLQVARKTPREMAQIGIAYVAGVFSAYFLLGLGLSELVARIVVFRQAAFVLNVGMAVFALVVAVLSLRDGVRCLQGRLQDMSLQLPAVFKDRIRAVIRKSVPQRGFVLAAFGAGALISLLELACTGQVYAPTILYMIQAGRGGAVGYLLLYNFAFILPLAIVFIMAFFGLTSGKLTAFLQRRAAMVKFGMAILFFALAFVLIAREWQG